MTFPFRQFVEASNSQLFSSTAPCSKCLVVPMRTGTFSILVSRNAAQPPSGNSPKSMQVSAIPKNFLFQNSKNGVFTCKQLQVIRQFQLHVPGFLGQIECSCETGGLPCKLSLRYRRIHFSGAFPPDGFLLRASRPFLKTPRRRTLPFKAESKM